MRAAAGQALRWGHRLLRLAVALALGLCLALGVLAWRLAEGPLAIPAIARQVEQTVNARLDRPGDPALEVGGAAIAWEGWRGGAAAPVDIRLTGVRLRDPGGGLRADLPDAAITLSVRALLRGRVLPATAELRGPSLLLHRDAEGRLSLGPGPGGPSPGDATGAAPEAQDAGSPLPLDRLLAELAAPDAEHASLAGFRRLRITGGSVLVVDHAMDRRWSLSEVGIDIRRRAGGGLFAEGAAVAETAGLGIPVRLTGSLEPAPPQAGGGPAAIRLSTGLVLPALRPAQIAALLPGLEPLRLLDAAVSLSATATFDGEGRPQRLDGRLEAGPGALDLGDGRRLPFAGMEAEIEGQGGTLRLPRAVLRLPSPGAAPGPVLHATGTARREGPAGTAWADSPWSLGFDLALDPFGLPALGRLWPEGMGGEARGLALATLQAGLVREARVQVALRAAPGFETLRLASARAELAVEAAMLDMVPLGVVAPGTASSRFVAERLEAAVAVEPGAARLERVVLRLPAPRPASPAATSPGAASSGAASPGGPALVLRGGVRREQAGAGAEAWRAGFDLALEGAPLRLAELGTYWPAGVRPNERDWLTTNVTAGELRRGAWRLEAELPAGAGLDPGGLRVTAFSGTAEGAEATVHWLRPVPPVTGVEAVASFSTEEIVIRARGGRQQAADGGRSGIEAREAVVRFSGFDEFPGQAEIAAQLAGPLPEIMALLRHPRLKLFERRKVDIGAAGGQAEGRVQVAFPLLNALPAEEVRIRASARVADGRLTDVVAGQPLDRAALALEVDTEGLRVTGQGVLAEAPVRLAVEMDFRPGAATQVTERATATAARAEPRTLAAFGLDVAGFMEGPATALEARYERRRGGQGQVGLRADLREARLMLEPVNYLKPPGAPAQVEATLRLSGEALAAVEGLRLDGPDLALRGRVEFGPGNRLERLVLNEGALLGGSRFGGEVRRPRREGGPWTIALQGPLLDLRPILAPTQPAPAAPTRRPGAAERRAEAAEGAGPGFAFELRFDRATTGEGRNLLGLAGNALVDGRGLLREAHLAGRTAPQGGGFEAALVPRGRERHLQVTAADGGALLRAFDLVDSIQGGRLTLTAVYPELRPGAPLHGTAELDQFVVRNAPAVAKLLQAMTLYGVLDAMRGGNGLVFTRLVAPFTLTREALALADARAFSSSLGLTAKGRIWREREQIELEGTVVPAYFFNQLLGNIPLIGRLFSPERGGGVFAATYRVQGPLSDPAVSVNPLAALTPGFLRGVFGLQEGVLPGAPRGLPPPNPTDRDAGGR